MLQISDKHIRKFNQRVDRGDADTCWPWLGGLDAYGYGQFSVGRRKLKTHRLAFLFTGKTIPKGLCILHSCDNPKCCNPKHLRIGSHGDNHDDMVKRNRQSKGEKHAVTQRGESNGRAKVKAADIHEIRRLYDLKTPLKEIAVKFGICNQMISRIGLREAWRSVT